jgi:hypothetical protein
MKTTEAIGAKTTQAIGAKTTETIEMTPITPSRFVACLSVSDVSFSHYGLANTTLTLAIVTLLTGVLLVVDRYWAGGRSHWRTIVRVLHVVVGVFMTAYLVGTYLWTPL